MSKLRKKEYLETDVWSETLNRIRYIYDSFDKVVVSFSGGKDSTAVLNATLVVAKERNKLPLEVVFFDEEAIHPPTIEYVRRVAEIEEIDLKWWCLEFKHRNACSNEEPFWYTWDKDKKDLWVRDMPEEALTKHPRFKKGLSFQEFSPYLYGKSDGKVAMLTGIRTEESFRRYKVIASKKNDAFIQAKSENGQNQYRCFPIYDWDSEDVWLAVKKFNWDYNKTYDIFNQTDFYGKFLKQRVCPPFGEEPLRSLWIYSECFPEMWHKMLNRVSGVATAWRYANTDLYGVGKIEKPENITYKQWASIIIKSYESDVVKLVKKNLNSIIKRHKDKTDDPIPDKEVHPLTGTSWQFICKLCIKGDLKGRTGPKLENNAISALKKLGIESFDEAVMKYGSTKYKQKRGLI